jgi:DnaJ-class molecular chaperone
MIKFRNKNKVETPVEQICPVCNGDGFWHNPKTGYRLATACDQTVVDKSRACTKCNGSGKASV